MPGKRWKLTSMGRAVFDSAMPPDLAVQMHQELESKILQGFSLHEPLQAIFVLLVAGKIPVTAIFDWSHWHKKFLVSPPDGRSPLYNQSQCYFAMCVVPPWTPTHKITGHLLHESMRDAQNFQPSASSQLQVQS